MVVAIDGPAGAGKSSIAERCSAELGFTYLNSGAIYRAVTWKALEQGLEDAPDERIAEIAEALRLQYRDGRLIVDGEPRDAQLHSDRVDRHVARHSAIATVREMVNRRLREIADGAHVVVEGRDITTVVFPNADVKIYLDASVETRAQRRWQQQRDQAGRQGGPHGETPALQEIAERIRERDEADRKKTTGSLKQSPDAIYLDTSLLTIDEVCEKVIATIRNTREYQELQS